MKIYAHRGASGYAPENTLEAFELAIVQKADGIETDVHQTKDGVLVLMHDERIDRTTNGKGYIKDYTYQELLEFNANNGNKKYSFCKIPLLEQLLVLVKKHHLLLNIEIKTDIIFYPMIEDKVVAMVHKYQVQNQVLYSSFNHYSMMKIKQLDKEARVSLLYEGELYQPWKYASALEVEGLHPSLPNLVIENYVAMCHLYDLVVNVWTINKKEDVKKMKALGVDGIFTNFPDIALQIQKEGKNQ